MPIKKENYYLIRRHFIRLFKNECAICHIKCNDDGKYDTDNGFCIMEFDHIKPNGIMRHDVSRSVREWEWFKAFYDDNLQLLCRHCNQIKSNKIL